MAYAAKFLLSAYYGRISWCDMAQVAILVKAINTPTKSIQQNSTKLIREVYARFRNEGAEYGHGKNPACLI